MSKPIMYSTNCPKCKILEKKLQQKKIEFEINDDIDEMMKKGMTHVPNLEVNGDLYDFDEARKLIDEYTPEDCDFVEFVASKKSE